MIKILATEFSIPENLISNIVKLIDDGNTVPFIARYRKEQTGSADDQVLREIYDRLAYLRGLEQRREEIINSINEQEKMTDEIMSNICKAETLARLEDVYRPFKQKRRTRAIIAKEQGLENLALMMLEKQTESFENLAQKFAVDIENVAIDMDISQIRQGVCDILAEIMSDDADIRATLRVFMWREAIISTKQASDKDSVYTMYYDYSEEARKMQNHRVLAINRGEKEGFLKVRTIINDNNAIAIIKRKYVIIDSSCHQIIRDACDDSFERLIFPSIERELRAKLLERAFSSAITVFGLNLKQLLMSPPIKGKVCLALDPGYRTGCKIAVCDENGDVLKVCVIYPTPPQNQIKESKSELAKLIKQYKVEIIAVGNGTASKESEIFISELIKDLNQDELAYMMVNEAGASVYSASKLASQEFPELDVSLRSAVSIARRLQDPLCELVKIDPKSIGVGQYQHDMPSAELSFALSNAVEDCVNKIGVDLNTASPSILSYISGISQAVSKNIVNYRLENGNFKTRKELLKVAKLGPKAYEQCAGFLRINGDDILDNTGVHPESYKATKKILEICSYSLEDVKNANISEITDGINEIGAEKVCDFAKIGKPTLDDIVKELLKPGRDIRDELAKPLLRKDVKDIRDLKEGMEIIGTVRNVIDFGVFVDIAVHQDGLVHITQISDKYIKHPSEILSVGDIVTVWVMSVELEKNRISLTMKKPAHLK